MMGFNKFRVVMPWEQEEREKKEREHLATAKAKGLIPCDRCGCPTGEEEFAHNRNSKWRTDHNNCNWCINQLRRQEERLNSFANTL